MSENKFKKEIKFIIISNILLGILTTVYIDTINLYLNLGLWHKILYPYGIYFPIGVISVVILSSLCTYFVITIIIIDYKVYKNGLEAIEFKEKNRW